MCGECRDDLDKYVPITLAAFRFCGLTIATFSSRTGGRAGSSARGNPKEA
jgi:hypothetical protein